MAHHKQLHCHSIAPTHFQFLGARVTTSISIGHAPSDSVRKVPSLSIYANTLTTSQPLYR